MPKYPTNKSSSFTQDIETYTSNSQVTPHKFCANVLVPDYIKHVNSQMSKVVTKILSSDHVFKILSSLMKSNHNSFISSKILRQKHEHAFFFFLKKKQDKMCKCVSHNPKRKITHCP
jgi:hypothetical protein